MWENFNLWHVLWFVILGGGFGWLAGRAFPRRGLGWPGNVGAGVIGAVAGGLFLSSNRLLRFVDRLFGDGGKHINPLDFAALMVFGYMLWAAILGALVGWLAGRAFLDFGCLGNFALAVIGAGAGIVSFCLVGTLVGGVTVTGLMPAPFDLYNASLGAVLSLAIVIIFVRRR